MSSSRFKHHPMFYIMYTVWPFISSSPNCLATVLYSGLGERHDALLSCHFEFHSVFSSSENHQPTLAKQEPIVFSLYCCMEITCPSSTDLELQKASVDQSWFSDITNLAKTWFGITSTCGISSVLR